MCGRRRAALVTQYLVVESEETLNPVVDPLYIRGNQVHNGFTTPRAGALVAAGF